MTTVRRILFRGTSGLVAYQAYFGVRTFRGTAGRPLKSSVTDCKTHLYQFFVLYHRCFRLSTAFFHYLPKVAESMSKERDFLPAALAKGGARGDFLAKNLQKPEYYDKIKIIYDTSVRGVATPMRCRGQTRNAAIRPRESQNTGNRKQEKEKQRKKRKA